MDPGAILKWLKYKKIVKNRKITEASLLQLNSLSVTFHGRLMLNEVCLDEYNGLPPEIRRIYWVILQMAPIQEYAEWN